MKLRKNSAVVRTAMIAVIPLLAAILMFASCANPLSSTLQRSSGSDNAVPDSSESDDGGGGSISISVPSLAPWVFEAFAAAAAAGNGSNTDGYTTFSTGMSSGLVPAAFAATDTVEIVVTDPGAGEALVNQTSFGRDVAPGSSFGGSIVVPPGTGYTVTVNIYVSAVSEIDPVVSGSTAGVDVTAGVATDITVRCLPVNPTLLSGGTPQDYTLVPYILNADGYPAAIGGEIWYQFTAPASGYAEFDVSVPSGGAYALGLFNIDGSAVQEVSIYDGVRTGSRVISGLSPGADYFVALLVSGSTQDPVSGQMTFTELVPVPLTDMDVPDPELRALLEYYTGKEFTTAVNPNPAAPVLDVDLAEISSIRTDGYNGGPVTTGITDLTGLEYCDSAFFLLLNGNDLSVPDMNLDAIGQMDSLLVLDAVGTQLQDLTFLLSAPQLQQIKVYANPDLDLTDLLNLSAANFPNLETLGIGAWDSTSDGVPDFVTSAEWDQVVALLDGHANLTSIGLSGFMDSDAMFTTLWTGVLSERADTISELSLDGNPISETALSSLANLTTLSSLNLLGNTALTDISWISTMTSVQYLSVSGTGVTDITPLQTLFDGGGISGDHWEFYDLEIDACGSLDLGEGTDNGNTLLYLLQNGINVKHDATWTGAYVAEWEYMFSAPGGAYAHGITYDGTDLWMVDRGADAIYRISIADGALLQEFPAPTGSGSGTGLTWDGSSLWYTHDYGAGGELRIYQINPADGTVLSDFASPASGDSTGLTWDGTHLWVTGFGESYYRVSTTGIVDRSLPAAPDYSEGLTWANGKLWNLYWETDQIVELDPADGTVLWSSPVAVGDGMGLAFDGTYIWLSTAEGRFYRFDPGSRSGG